MHPYNNEGQSDSTRIQDGPANIKFNRIRIMRHTIIMALLPAALGGNAQVVNRAAGLYGTDRSYIKDIDPDDASFLFLRKRTGRKPV